MDRYRIVPSFDTEKNRKSIVDGVALAVMSFFIGVLLFNSYLLHSIGAKGVAGALLAICSIPFLIFQVGMGVTIALEGVSGIIEKRNWLKNATTNQAAIIARKEEFYYPDSDNNAHNIYELGLKLNTIRATSESDEPCIWASVSKRVFRRYTHKDTALIYYPPASPLNFLIEGE